MGDLLATAKGEQRSILLNERHGALTRRVGGQFGPRLLCQAEQPRIDRPLHLAWMTGARLLTAKLNRLSRASVFLLTLRESGARYLAVDLREANDPTVGISALVAEEERETISRCTKEALAVEGERRPAR